MGKISFSAARCGGSWGRSGAKAADFTSECGEMALIWRVMTGMRTVAPITSKDRICFGEKLSHAL